MDRIDLAITLARGDVRLALSLSAGVETVALVGPSGAGKSTLLRAIAGLDRPDTGHIRIGDHVVFDSEAGIDVATNARRIGFVFPDLALFPHMSVADNVGYGGGDPRPLLERFGLGHLATERPDRLSSGERQRVAVARALAPAPDLLLMDEPLSALDVETRSHMRTELDRILRDLSIPVLLVTHDFDDALALADRIGVLIEGRMRQLATAEELLSAPADGFVARLAGVNLLQGTATRDAGGLSVAVLEDGLRVWSTDDCSGPVDVAIAPWDISLSRAGDPGSARNRVPGRVAALTPVANRVRVQVGPLVAEVSRAAVESLGLRIGDEIVATFKATATRFLAARERRPSPLTPPVRATWPTGREPTP